MLPLVFFLDARGVNMDELIAKLEECFPLCKKAINGKTDGERQAAAAMIAWKIREHLPRVTEILTWAWEEGGIQQCEHCGAWQGEKCCTECDQHLRPCSRCSGTGIDPTTQDLSGPYFIECRGCGG